MPELGLATCGRFILLTNSFRFGLEASRSRIEIRLTLPTFLFAAAAFVFALPALSLAAGCRLVRRR